MRNARLQESKPIDSKRARALGFETDKDLDEIVRNFIADDLDDQMKIAKA